MIVDNIGNNLKYCGAHRLFPQAFEFLKSADCSTLPLGRTDLLGDELYVLVGNGKGRERSGAQMEIHHRYMDIHFIVEGVESFGWSPYNALQHSATPYDEAQDFELFKDEPLVWFSLSPGMFTLFHSGEGHLPGVSDGIVRKIVVKVMD